MTAPDLHGLAFPVLDDEQVAELGSCSSATPMHFRPGDSLFQAGDRDVKFFIVRSGLIEILDGTTRIATHLQGEFTGDVSHLTGGVAMVSAVAREETDVYAVTTDALMELVNQCPIVGDVILRAFIARRQIVRESGTFTGLRVIGSRYSRDTFRIRDFLARNRVPFAWVDLEADPDVGQVLAHFGLGPSDTPVVLFRDRLLRNPSSRELADLTGIRRALKNSVYDLIVVGAGPAGLAAAVYGASEGLNTVVLERSAPGGQAGASMRIENYLGFPTGITGLELADRAVMQASKFGARLSVPVPALQLSFDQTYPVIHLDGGETVIGRSLLIATGADYSRLQVEGCEQFEGGGVYYAATVNEAMFCKGAEVVIVGGGNSAGQAAVFLSEYVRTVYLVVRGDDLRKNMSSYLAHRIEETDSIEVLCNTVVQRMLGDRNLSAVELQNTVTGDVRLVECPALFSFIGAVPRTDWLPADIETDAKGFVRTGPALTTTAAGRQPFLLETSRLGVFAVGDVRAGSVKRVASAVGEGSMAVQFVHEHLKGV
jgi:thioredoxin reductase (NADPH)